MKITYDERQEAARNRAWRRTCLIVIAAVFVNTLSAQILGYSVTLDALPIVLMWFALGVHSVQAVWDGAYFRIGENSKVLFILAPVMIVVLLVAFIRHVMVMHEGFTASGVMLSAPLLTFVPVLVTAWVRWIVDRRSTQE